MLDGREQILWPDHCVQGTHGAAFSAELESARIHHVVQKGIDREVDSYSAFFDNSHRRDTGLAAQLRSHGVDEVHIAGLATDYCVKSTALDALGLGLRVIVLCECIRGVELLPDDCHQALESMRAAGALLR